jgi:hypothetical protein
MRAHVIKNGIVTNTIEVESLDFMTGLVDASLGGKIGDMWDGKSFSEPPLSIEELEELLGTKKDSIREQAETAYETPVTLSDGSVWNGGMDSALAIDGAVRLAENAGLTQISLYDSTNAERVVDIATGKSIAAAVGAEYQRLFGIKQKCMVQLDGIDLTSATAKDEIEAVVFAS